MRGSMTTTRGMLLVLCLGAPALAGDWRDSISYQGVELQPGDVIVFRGGVFATALGDNYGHTALYLGRDEKLTPTFFDFSATRVGTRKYFSVHQARFMAEPVFLKLNGESHRSFNVFRFRDSDRIVKSLLWQEARRQQEQRYNLVLNNCASVAFQILKHGAASPELDTAPRADLLRPEWFSHGGEFVGVGGGRSVDLDRAFSEMSVRMKCEKYLPLEDPSYIPSGHGLLGRGSWGPTHIGWKRRYADCLSIQSEIAPNLRFSELPAELPKNAAPSPNGITPRPSAQDRPAPANADDRPDRGSVAKPSASPSEDSPSSPRKLGSTDIHDYVPYPKLWDEGEAQAKKAHGGSKPDTVVGPCGGGGWAKDGPCKK